MKTKPCGCPQIESHDWEGRTFNWEGKTFFSREVKHLFKVPLGVARRVAEAADIIEKRGYLLEEPLMVLVREGSFSGAILIAIAPPEEPAPEVVVFDNSFIETTVYSRPESKVGPGLTRFRRRLESEGKKIRSIYLWHLGCPRCCATEGYKTVIFAELG